GLHNDFRAKFLEHVPSLLKHATLNAGFSYSCEATDGPIEKWGKELEGLSAREYFGKPFMVYRVFSGEDVMHRLSFRRDYAELKDIIRKDKMLWDEARECPRDVKVSLAISPHVTPFRMLLEPEPLHPAAENGMNIPVYRADRIDLLAGKIGRILAAKHPGDVKPSDFLDIYNLCNAAPPILDLASTAPDSDVNKLRLLVVNYLADKRIRKPYNGEVNIKAFEPTPQNIERFLTKLAEEVPDYRMEKIKEKAPEIFETSRKLLNLIFDKRSDKSYGPLNYTPQEVRFTAAVFGDDPQAILGSAVKREGWSLLHPFRREAINVEADKLPPDCHIDIEPLVEQYGVLAASLGTNIRNNPWLQGEVEEARLRRLGSRALE
ncbi:MAG: hypothetical protein JO089_07770, partial [Alphaproteobacteria bacterium]|nr:hypothetical protein [Alphaproteobacteria bacterium]